jgi:hypothetical protein
MKLRQVLINCSARRQWMEELESIQGWLASDQIMTQFAWHARHAESSITAGERRLRARQP